MAGLVARHSTTRNHGVGKGGRSGRHFQGQMRAGPIFLRNEGRGAAVRAVRAVGEASEKD